MLLRYTCEDEENAVRIEMAVERALDSGLRTADIYEKGTRVASTKEMGDAVVANLK